MSNKEIIVYWSPFPFTKETSQWNMLYREPESVLSDLRLNRKKTDSINFWSCPVFIDTVKKTYQIKSNFDMDYVLPINEIIEEQKKSERFDINTGIVSFQSVRKPSLENYINLSLNISWIMFAEESVEVKLTAPYFPPVTPGEGIMLAPGKFDIGSWYRPLNIDYHIPTTTTELKFKKDDSLLYLEFLTDKKIVFKRYNFTNHLRELSDECLNFHNRFGKNIPLLDKYSVFKQSRMKDLILKEIKNNLID
jgi:hypothetical protein